MHDTRDNVLEILRNTKEFISGEQICKQLNISRTAVWKHIRSLRDLGYEITSMTNRGYRLEETTERPLDIEVQTHLTTQTLGQNLIYHHETGSTNADAMEMGKDDAPEGTLIIAERQTAGHGRMKRPWHSPANLNLYFSLLLRPQVVPYKAPQLALLTAAVIYDELATQFPNLDLGVKWPNDLYIGRQKLCGILCEMQAEMSMVHHVVIGIGINVNSTVQDFPEELQTIATSLKTHTGENINRACLLASLINRYEKYYQMWLKDGLKPFMATLNTSSILSGKELTIEFPTTEIHGIGHGIAEDGSLLIKNPDGTIRSVPSGEVHIKKF